jgi:hypothetical protein
MQIRQRQGLGKLLAQSELHFVFHRIDAVLCQASRFHVAIENHSFVSGERDFLRREKSRGSGANYEDSCQGYPPLKADAEFESGGCLTPHSQGYRRSRRNRVIELTN